MKLCIGPLVFWSLLGAQTVTSTRGNVVFEDAGGIAHQVTDSGKDSEPSLSQDRRQVVFVRALQEAPGIGVPTVVESELWVESIPPSGAPKQIFRGPLMMPDGRFSRAFYTPRFSANGAFIYFLADYSATSAALARLELASGKARFISPAVEYVVLLTGRFRGFLIANIRSLSPPDDNGITYPIYPYYLLTPAGKRYRRVADQDATLSDIVKKYSR